MSRLNHFLRVCLLSVLVLGGLFVASGLTSVQAQDLVYRPTNPAFGGSPSNYQWMLSSAKAQNPYQEGSGVSSFRDDPLANFEQRLQRQVLNQISQQVIQDRFGDIDLSEEGEFDFERFSVNVNPGPGSINIQVYNKQTGESSTIEIPRF